MPELNGRNHYENDNHAIENAKGGEDFESALLALGRAYRTACEAKVFREWPTLPLNDQLALVALMCISVAQNCGSGSSEKAAQDLIIHKKDLNIALSFFVQQTSHLTATAILHLENAGVVKSSESEVHVTGSTFEKLSAVLQYPWVAKKLLTERMCDVFFMTSVSFRLIPVLRRLELEDAGSCREFGENIMETFSGMIEREGVDQASKLLDRFRNFVDAIPLSVKGRDLIREVNLSARAVGLIK